MNYKEFSDLNFKYRESFRDYIAKMMFSNGFGILVLCKLAGERKIFEVAVLDSNEEIDNTTHVLSDTATNLDAISVNVLMRKIQRLEK